MTVKQVFTDDQMQDYAAYERVRSEGNYNMLSNQAREDSGLNKDKYMFVLKNYGALRMQYDDESKTPMNPNE